MYYHQKIFSTSCSQSVSLHSSLLDKHEQTKIMHEKQKQLVVLHFNFFHLLSLTLSLFFCSDNDTVIYLQVMVHSMQN